MAGNKTSKTETDADDKAKADAVDAEGAFVTDPDDRVDLDESETTIEGAVFVDVDEDAAKTTFDDLSDDDDLAELEAAEQDWSDDWDKTADELTEVTEAGDAEETPFEERLRETIKPEPAPKQKSGFIPMLLGGLIAGGVGYGAAYVGLQQGNEEATLELRQEITAQLQAQSESIAAVSGQIGNLPPPADLTTLETGQSDLSDAIAGLTSRIDATESQIGDLDARLTNLEKRPITENASEAAVAAYERELKALQDAMEAQRSDIEARAAEAQALDQNAKAIAQATQRRAALTSIQNALESGEGFVPALADLEAAGLPAPQALVAVAEEGAATLSLLQEEFPDAARAALAVSRRAEIEQGEGGGLSGFLQAQLGARSLEPRDGDDPDAVLSRAEAAARDGRLADALAEIEALPEEGRAELSEWIAKASLRLDALAASDELGKELN